MKDLIIILLFRLLGCTDTRLFNIQYLFGASTGNHESRKKRWEKALLRLWRDKDMLDYLYYQSESDKEMIFQGKLDRKLSQGARIRTLFIVYSAKMAYQKMLKSKRSTASDKAEADEEIQTTGTIYKKLVSVK